MKRLMFGWVMDEAAAPSGEGAGGGAAAGGGDNGEQGGNSQGGDVKGADGQGGDGEGSDGEGAERGDKPFLGGDEPKDGDGPTGAEANQPAVGEDEYLRSVKADEAVFGKDKVAFDPGLVKSVIPVCQKYGIAPEAANALANAFAKAQLEGAQALMKERVSWFREANEAAKAKYDEGGFRQINAGIDKWFKPGGTMNAVIRNSELGSDPEFLALMHHLGGLVKADTLKGTAEGGGSGGGDANGIDGMAKIWK